MMLRSTATSSSSIARLVVSSQRRFISSTIFIKGLPTNTTIVSLKESLHEYGEIRHAVLFKNLENSTQKQNARVDFYNIDSALAAQDELDQNIFMGKRIDVEFPVKEFERIYSKQNSGSKNLIRTVEPMKSSNNIEVK